MEIKREGDENETTIWCMLSPMDWVIGVNIEI